MGYSFWKYLHSDTHSKTLVDFKTRLPKVSPEEQAEIIKLRQKQLDLIKLSTQTPYNLFWLMNNYDPKSDPKKESLVKKRPGYKKKDQLQKMKLLLTVKLKLQKQRRQW